MAFPAPTHIIFDLDAWCIVCIVVGEVLEPKLQFVCSYFLCVLWVPFFIDMRHLKEVNHYVHRLNKGQMVDLGVVLGLDYIKLSDKMDSPLFHKEVIAAWLRREDYVTDDERQTPTWGNLVAALRDDTVGQNGVASLIYNHKGLRFL